MLIYTEHRALHHSLAPSCKQTRRGQWLPATPRARRAAVPTTTPFNREVHALFLAFHETSNAALTELARTLSLNGGIYF
ncbi:unnamed protein product [Pieris macdunnoughi]|uniref:Uncharacterized protein n=1 Tax=Pieris macdunnoughi TaxID=345717 RepID=A0A821L2R2_9NEOP|nr:unnamed protein product [Pieris macdunnoughi]